MSNFDEVENLKFKKNAELTKSSHQLHSGLPAMHSAHVWYFLHSEAIEFEDSLSAKKEISQQREI